MKGILWIEDTDASEKDISETMGRPVTICTSKKDIQKILREKRFGAIVMDDLVDNADQIIQVLEEETKAIPVLVLTQKNNPFGRNVAVENLKRVKEPFGIDDIEIALNDV